MKLPAAHPKVIERARQVLALDPIFLDTETTGTGPQDLIIEVGIVDLQGEVLYDGLVNPGVPIPAVSTAVNQITDAMVADAPRWPEVWAKVEPILQKRAIGIYNAEFDWTMLKQSCQASRLPWTLEDGQAFCMMKLFAAYYGEWNTRHNGFKSQKLEFAGRICQIDLPNSHQAVDDARLTAALLRYLASQ
jgi:DNA polymerase-3 subunit epsilon